MHDEMRPAATYYDLQTFPNDVPLYRKALSARDHEGEHGGEVDMLELGCGSARVMLALADQCGFLHGIDLSPAMIDIAQEKITSAGYGPEKAIAEVGDITRLDLGRQFDFIIAPFRVMQALASDEQVEGLMATIRKHLAPGGSCILTAFNPNLPRNRMPTEWARESETPNFECMIDGDRVEAFDVRKRLQESPLVLFPELGYRRFRDGELIEEIIMPIVMRCWYPSEFTALIESHNFIITHRWGGYDGEAYGEGPELVVQFKAT